MFKSYEEMLEELDREMRRLSDDMLMQMFRLPGSAGQVWSPRVDVYETKDDLVIKVCAAGIKPEQVEVSLSADDRFLTVRGVRTEGNIERRGVVRYYQLEVYYGPFERVIPLPAEVMIDRERLQAVYTDGFLVVILPKKREAEPRSVPITE
ncbi:MAG: Hsp20/alpha crystallin family protein [Armatimonadetes bacterium]|nr:Hsp20/alpha crystallin family protein [Armatimonadota bacterium]